LIFDAHCDTMVRAESPETFLSGGGNCHVALPGLRESGVAPLVTALCIEPYPERLADVWEHGTRNFRECSRLSGDVRLHFALEGCMPLYLGMELPAQPLVASLTWNGDNPYGSGIGGKGGLTSAGVSLARMLDARGTRLDASHLNDRSRHDLLSMGIPVCATHCNSRKLCDFPRNLPDPDLKEIAANGGVIGVTLVPDFLLPEGGDPSVSDVARHIEYIAGIAGIDSVGLGSDFDGIKLLPRGIRNVLDIHLIFDELSKAGWNDTDIAKVSSGNWMRFFSL